MKKKNYWQVLFLTCLLTLFISALAFEDAPFVNINNISIHPGKFITKIHVETSSPLPTPTSYYAQEMPTTIVVDLEGVQTGIAPLIIPDEPSLIEEINLKDRGDNKIRLFIHLNEKVPYCISSKQESTVIELTKVQTKLGEYYTEREKTDNKTVYLEKIDVSENGNSIDIRANLSEEAVYQVFALANPMRLVVDLFDTLYSKSHSVHPVNKHGISKVRASQFRLSNPEMITRIVFDLTEPKLYALNSKENDLVISFYGNGSPQTYSSSEPPSPLQEEKPLPEIVPDTPKAPEIKQPEPEIAQEPPKPEIPKTDKVKEDKPKAVSDPPKLDLPEVTEVEPKEEKEEVKPPLLAEKTETLPASPPPVKKTEPPLPTSSAEANVTLQDKLQEEQFKPKTIREPEEKYTGDTLSLKFKDADLRDVILYLGEFAGLNVVFDPEVRGTVTVDLKDVPWDQALDIILKINKMGKTLEGNILRISPISILTREKEEQRRLTESEELVGPIIVRTFTLSYSKAGEVQKLLQTKLSTRGEIVIDARTNTLIISDTRERIELIEKLISIFDTATPQVAIEARIVEATSNFVRNLGVQWGFRGIADPFYGNQTALEFPSKVLVDGAIIPQGLVTKGIGGPLGGYAVNLPAPAFSTAMGLSFANIMDTFRLDIAISAMETSGEGRIISAPQVTTQNNQEAEILQGRQIPVQTVANFTVTTQYVNAALELRATPQITAEGTIIMYIEIRNNAADFANLVNGIPPIITQSAKTTVMVPDGGTTVIGGIYRTEDSITRERVPFFHKIPILGSLFKSFARTKQNRELLIFITPRIIK